MMKVRAMSIVYARLIQHGRRTYKSVPASYKEEVKYVLTEWGLAHLATEGED